MSPTNFLFQLGGDFTQGDFAGRFGQVLAPAGTSSSAAGGAQFDLGDDEEEEDSVSALIA